MSESQECRLSKPPTVPWIGNEILPPVIDNGLADEKSKTNYRSTPSRPPEPAPASTTPSLPSNSTATSSPSPSVVTALSTPANGRPASSAPTFFRLPSSRGSLSSDGSSRTVSWHTTPIALPAILYVPGVRHREDPNDLKYRAPAVAAALARVKQAGSKPSIEPDASNSAASSQTRRRPQYWLARGIADGELHVWPVASCGKSAEERSVFFSVLEEREKNRILALDTSGRDAIPDRHQACPRYNTVRFVDPSSHRRLDGYLVLQADCRFSAESLVYYPHRSFSIESFQLKVIEAYIAQLEFEERNPSWGLGFGGPAGSGGASGAGGAKTRGGLHDAANPDDGEADDFFDDHDDFSNDGESDEPIAEQLRYFASLSGPGATKLLGMAERFEKVQSELDAVKHEEQRQLALERLKRAGLLQPIFQSGQAGEGQTPGIEACDAGIPQPASDGEEEPELRTPANSPPQPVPES
ncbi:hypothetical protein B0H11DRAFT_2251413 [Mycena galericulata]|nr:hypothetical protein B0H11DRAFT_2251413 [Mycena galericulata]